MPDLLVKARPGTTSEATFCDKLLAHDSSHNTLLVATYEISQMDMTIGIEKYIVWLDITMDDVLLVNVFQGAS